MSLLTNERDPLIFPSLKYPMLRTLAYLCVFVTLSSAYAAKAPPMLLRVHTETTEKDGSVFSMPVQVGDAAIQVHVEKMPLITEHNVKMIYPFPSPMGGYGCYFKLDQHGTNGWEQITTNKRDRFVVVIFNGRTLARMRIDRPVADGIVLVPGGITPEEIFTMGRRYPYIGEDSSQTQKRRSSEQALFKQEKRASPKPSPSPKPQKTSR